MGWAASSVKGGSSGPLSKALRCAGAWLLPEGLSAWGSSGPCSQGHRTPFKGSAWELSEWRQEEREGSWSCEVPPVSPCHCRRWMRPGRRRPHLITRVQLLFTGPWGKSEQCWVVAGRRYQAGGSRRGRGGRLLNTLHLGLASGLAWQKFWKMKRGGLSQRRGKGGGEDQERDTVCVSRSHVLCGRRRALPCPEGESEERKVSQGQRPERGGKVEPHNSKWIYSVTPQRAGD